MCDVCVRVCAESLNRRTKHRVLLPDSSQQLFYVDVVKSFLQWAQLPLQLCLTTATGLLQNSYLYREKGDLLACVVG